MAVKKIEKKSPIANKNIQIVIAGAGGIIGGALARYFHDKEND
jgi:hypothetical protein